MAGQRWYAKKSLGRVRSIALGTNLSNKLRVTIIELLDAAEDHLDRSETLRGLVSRDAFADILAAKVILPLKAQLATSTRIRAMDGVKGKTGVEAPRDKGEDNHAKLVASSGDVDAAANGGDDFGDWGDEDFTNDDDDAVTSQMMAPVALSQRQSSPPPPTEGSDDSGEEDWGDEGFSDKEELTEAPTLPARLASSGDGDSDEGNDEDWGDEDFGEQELEFQAPAPLAPSSPLPSNDLTSRPQLFDIRELCTERLVEDANRLKRLEKEVVELRLWKKNHMSISA